MHCRMLRRDRISQRWAEIPKRAIGTGKPGVAP